MMDDCNTKELKGEHKAEQGIRTVGQWLNACLHLESWEMEACVSSEISTLVVNWDINMKCPYRNCDPVGQ